MTTHTKLDRNTKRIAEAILPSTGKHVAQPSADNQVPVELVFSTN